MRKTVRSPENTPASPEQFAGDASIALPVAPNTLKQKRKITRRRFLKGILAAGGAAMLGEAVYGSNTLEVTRHHLILPGLRFPARLVQLSDLHRSWCVNEDFIAAVVDRANSLNPDIVALTGDFVTRHSDYMPSCLTHLKRLHAPLGLFAVLGNHDYQCDLGQGAPVIEAALVSANVQMLTNGSVRLDNNLRLVGVDDGLCGSPNVEFAFSGACPGEAVLAMTHNPRIFPQMAPYDCVTIAGHTHGGQINVPVLTNALFHDRMRYKRGWYREPSGQGRMYVSRGLGVVGIPCRVRSLPEIAVFDLTST